MKPLPACLLALLFLSLVPLSAGLVLKPNDVMAICGDSITQQKIYSVFMEDYFLMCQPVEGLRIAQFGWGGERAGNLPAFKELAPDSTLELDKIAVSGVTQDVKLFSAAQALVVPVQHTLSIGSLP